MGSLPGKIVPSRGDRRSREFDDFKKQCGQCGLREGSEREGRVRQGKGGPSKDPWLCCKNSS